MFSWIAESLNLQDDSPRYTLVRLKALYGHFTNWAFLSESRLIETLRSLSEFMVYADQNETSAAHALFDYFQEHPFLIQMLNILDTYPSNFIQIQILQSLSILFQNISKQNSLYFLLSNNYINLIITSDGFSTDREEIRDWYITFLKALAIRLDSETIQFFYPGTARRRRSSEAGYGRRNILWSEFPLYTCAIQYASSKESMIRIAVRTILLQIYAIKDIKIQTYLSGRHLTYLTSVCASISHKSTEVHNYMDTNSEENTMRMNDGLEDYSEDLYYLQDLLDIEFVQLGYLLSELFFEKVVMQLYIASILPRCQNEEEGRMCSALALQFLSRFFMIVQHAPLVNAVALVLLHPENTVLVAKYAHASLGVDGIQKSTTAFSEKTITTAPLWLHGVLSCEKNDPSCFQARRYPSGDVELDEVVNITIANGSNSYRTVLVHYLASTNTYISYSTMLLLCTIVNNNSVDQALLRDAKLSPHRRFRKENIMKKLTTSPRHGSGPSSLFQNDDVEEEEESSENEMQEGGLHYWEHCVHLLLHQCTLTARMINVHVAVRLILDLVLDAREEAPYLNEQHTQLLQNKLQKAAESVQRLLKTNETRSFLSIFEKESQLFHAATFPIPISDLVTSPLQFHQPTPTTSSAPSDPLQYQQSTASAAPLPFRSATNQIEELISALHLFWTLRKLRWKVLGSVPEDVLPPTTAKSSDTIPLHLYEASFFDHSILLPEMKRTCYLQESGGPFPLERKELMVVVHNACLMIVESVGKVVSVAALENISAAVDTTDARFLHLTIASKNPVGHAQKSGTKEDVWHLTLLFTEIAFCKNWKKVVERNINELMHAKMDDVVACLRAYTQKSNDDDSSDESYSHSSSDFSSFESSSEYTSASEHSEEEKEKATFYETISQ